MMFIKKTDFILFFKTNFKSYLFVIILITIEKSPEK